MWRMKIAAIAAALFAMTGAANSQSSKAPYPDRMVRIVVPFGAGSATDVLARMLANKFSEIWSQQVVVENRPGLAGTASVAKADPDGYTLMLTSNGHTVIGSLNRNLSFDPVKDFVGITQVANIPVVLVVPPALPAKTLAEVIAMAKEQPGKLNFASAGLASTGFIAGELFRQTAGINIVHVPHRSAPEATTSTLRGETQLNFVPLNTVLDFVQTGQLRGIALAAAKRNAAAPNVPTFAEAGMELDYDAWFGLMGQSAMPAATVHKIADDTAQVLQMPDVKTFLAGLGASGIGNSPERFDQTIKADEARFGDLLKRAGVKIE